MKKIVITLLMLCVLGVSLAQGTPGTLSNDDINYIKAVVAKEINIISLGTAKGTDAEVALNDLSKFHGDKLTLENIKSAIPANFDKNIKIIDEIELRKISSKSNSDEVINKLFEIEVIKNFFNNPKRNISQTMSNVKKTVLEHFNSKVISASEDEDEIKANNNDLINKETLEIESNTQVKKVKEANSKDKISSNVRNIRNNEDSEGFNFFWLLILIPILALISCIVIFFKKWKDEKIKSNQLKERVHELENRCDDFERKCNKFNSRCVALEQENHNLHNTIEELKSQQKNTNDSISHIPNLKQEERDNPEKIYAFQAEDGVFAYVSNSNSGESMYEITTTTEGNGTFVFINSSMAVTAAQNSRSMFIESACEIVNEETRRFSQIETITPGRVSKTSRGWEIIKKAQVRLA